MNGIDYVTQILKQEGVEWLSCFPSNPLISAAAREGMLPFTDGALLENFVERAEDAASAAALDELDELAAAVQVPVARGCSAFYFTPLRLI